MTAPAPAAKRRALLTIPAAAELLGLSPRTIEDWISQRKISYLKIGRAVRIDPAEIERILAESTIPARRGK